jgi:hypothetical protein
MAACALTDARPAAEEEVLGKPASGAEPRLSTLSVEFDHARIKSSASNWRRFAIGGAALLASAPSGSPGNPGFAISTSSRWPAAGKLVRMSNTRAHRPTLSSLARVLPEYGKFRFDRTLEAARNDIGWHADPANPVHATRLRIWLNQWLCRIGYPESGNDVFVHSLATWWGSAKDALPPEDKRLAVLADADLEAVSSVYGDLYIRSAAVNKTGRSRQVGPTAAAKLLYFVRPFAVTAWDKAISMHTGQGHDQAAFLRHLTTCRSWAVSLEAEGRDLGLRPTQIGPYLGRPASSVAKLIDEWLYATITGGLGPVDPGYLEMGGHGG